jgi:hypothetical protein
MYSSARTGDKCCGGSDGWCNFPCYTPSSVQISFGDLVVPGGIRRGEEERGRGGERERRRERERGEEERGRERC